MTLIELLEYVFEETGIEPSAQVISRLNRSNNRIATELEIPALYLHEQYDHAPLEPFRSIVKIKGAWNGKYKGVLQWQKRLPVLTVGEANAQHPDWKTRPPHKQFLLWDTAKKTIEPVGLGLELAEFYLHVVVKPNAMAENHDEPLNGMLPQHHELIANDTIFRLGTRNPNLSNISALHLAALQEGMRKAWVAAQGVQPVVLPVTEKRYYK